MDTLLQELHHYINICNFNVTDVTDNIIPEGPSTDDDEMSVVDLLEIEILKLM